MTCLSQTALPSNCSASARPHTRASVTSCTVRKPERINGLAGRYLSRKTGIPASKTKTSFSELKHRLQMNGRIIPWTQTHKAMNETMGSHRSPPETDSGSPPAINTLDTTPQPIFTMEELHRSLNKLLKESAPYLTSCAPSYSST